MAEISGKPIRFEDASKSFGDFQALTPTTLDIEAGEFLTLLGPSGSGKTTLLNITAGYLEPTSGRIVIGGQDVTHLPPRRRNIGMVFQNYALFPHMSVAENVAYGPKVRRLPKAEVERRVAAALALVQMERFADRGITAISGGQQQRVALARALAVEPDVILMDEPLGALDRQLRKYVQLEIRRLHVSHGRTTIYVTHDQEEALVMSDRIGVMREGQIVQVGSAAELYEHPKDTFVASFLGESNLIRGTVREVADGRARLGCPQLGLEILGVAAGDIAVGQRAAALIRPEKVRLANGVGLYGVVSETVYLGEIIAVKLELPDGTEFWARDFAKAVAGASGKVRASWDEDDVRILPIT